jgi:FKBP-type peptidyl-prolyl cis-trans isomerase
MNHYIKLLHSTAFPGGVTTTLKNNKQLPDGIMKSIIVPGNGQRVRLGDIATLIYSCYVVVPDPDHDTKQGGEMSSTLFTTTTKPFAKSSVPQKFVIGKDGTMIEGWDIALRSMEIGERSIIRIQDTIQYGYGKNGYPPYIPADHSSHAIEMDITLLDASPPTLNIDFDSIAEIVDQNLPRTASEIAQAYQIRQELKALNEPVLEGYDYWINKISNFYFYGFFDSETGATTPPWFLRPSITFPLAFAIVGITFYITLSYGAITERGIPTKDELDEIILSSFYVMMMMNPKTSFMG